eukprot:2377248-Ditylum_brightwellii.AAC.1
MFIPARVWLITLPETYKTLLRKHNAYLQNTTAIALEGIHSNVAKTAIEGNSEWKSVQEYLTRKSNLIELMERTNKTDSDRKLLFIVRKQNVSAAANFLDNELQEIFKTVVPEDLKFDGFPSPSRAKSTASRAVGLYAAVLQGMANPQEEEDQPISGNLNPI